MGTADLTPDGRPGAGAGPTDWLAAQYDRHGQQVYSLALHLVNDQAEAEEVVVEAFLALHRAGRSDEAGINAHLLRLTQNIASLRLNRRSPQPEAEPPSRGHPMTEISNPHRGRPANPSNLPSLEREGRRTAPPVRHANDKGKQGAAEGADDGITTLPPLAADVEGSQVD